MGYPDPPYRPKRAEHTATSQLIVAVMNELTEAGYWNPQQSPGIDTCPDEYRRSLRLCFTWNPTGNQDYAVELRLSMSELIAVTPEVAGAKVARQIMATIEKWQNKEQGVQR